MILQKSSGERKGKPLLKENKYSQDCKRSKLKKMVKSFSKYSLFITLMSTPSFAFTSSLVSLSVNPLLVIDCALNKEFRSSNLYQL